MPPCFPKIPLSILFVVTQLVLWVNIDSWRLLTVFTSMILKAVAMSWWDWWKQMDERLFTFSSKRLLQFWTQVNTLPFHWCWWFSFCLIHFCSCVLYRMWAFNFHPCCSSLWVSLKCACINLVQCVSLKVCLCVPELYPCLHHQQTEMSMSLFAVVAFLYLPLLLIIFSTSVTLQEETQTNCSLGCEC